MAARHHLLLETIEQKSFDLKHKGMNELNLRNKLPAQIEQHSPRGMYC